MSAILVKIDKKNKHQVTKLAKELGGSVLSINSAQFEDIALGLEMDRVKTGENVDREKVFQKLNENES